MSGESDFFHHPRYSDSDFNNKRKVPGLKFQTDEFKRIQAQIRANERKIQTANNPKIRLKAWSKRTSRTYNDWNFNKKK